LSGRDILHILPYYVHGTHMHIADVFVCVYTQADLSTTLDEDIKKQQKTVDRLNAMLHDAQVLVFLHTFVYMLVYVCEF
jgi:hypothetical protein